MSSESPSNLFPSQFVDGYQVPGVLSAELVRSAISYKPRDGDIFVATYPKCGTTWAHHTLSLIMRHGENCGEKFDIVQSSPHIEIIGAKGMDAMQWPRIFMMHFPFHLAPWSDKAKYIHVARNPKDACVSNFHHHNNIPIKQWFSDFDVFLEHFLSGDMEFGDYFDHLQGWYEHRNDPNVLFLTFEEMKENPEEAILKMASFVDDEKYAEPLRKDRKKLENVVKYSSFEEMKVVIDKAMDEFNSMEDADKSEMPEEIKEMMSKIPLSRETIIKSSNFVRKGIVGDWRNHFSAEQSRRMDEKFAERIKIIEIAKLWEKYM